MSKHVIRKVSSEAKFWMKSTVFYDGIGTSQNEFNEILSDWYQIIYPWREVYKSLYKKKTNLTSK